MSDELKATKEYKGEILTLNDGDTSMELVSDPTIYNEVSILLKDQSDDESACIVLDEKKTHMVISVLLNSRYGKSYRLPNLYDLTDKEILEFMEQRKEERIEEAKEELFRALGAAYNAGMTIEDIQEAARNF
ncbi:gp91 [Bacillus phage W.Ph.]|uniref:Gp91 n=1 Tax=Bacillus phage W.Ph. TaxID=764595 RepID=G9B1J2_9CAUD|nr:gp91 [Bacillus phage W.Ph.]ADH03237.1 gp91 [Bacillus phage W.Ph.]